MRTALTIAGSDCSGGAGIQADLKTMMANGVYAMSVITALTAQNTMGVSGIMEVTPEFLKKQLDAVFTDIKPDAVKIGMVASAELIHVIAERLSFYKPKFIVVDPVMVSTSGSRLIEEDAVAALQNELLPMASVITPNIPETEVLTGTKIDSKEKMEQAIVNIKAELEERVKFFKSEDKLIEAQRIAERTNFDIEMMQETGFCSGIENYSRHLAGLPAGVPPYTLMDYFPDDFLIIVDESHITIPQIRGMYAGDQSRKSTLVDYGFRLPSAKDNGPLNFTEFENKISQMLFVSATPAAYERDHELLSAEQIIRPTGLLDPEISVRPIDGQIDDLVSEIHKETEKHNKILVTTLTKRMAEDLTDYLKELGIRVKYLHADIDTLERQRIIRDMRLDAFDVLVGINLLREGLDIPEISLVAILDADKEGFLRTETSLVQTIGRAARNSEGHVIMYADKITESMEKAIGETERRRKIQQAYNEEHGITPQTIRKAVRDLISISRAAEADDGPSDTLKKDYESMSVKELEKVKKEIEKNMHKAAAELNFEEAAALRDKMIEINQYLYENK